MLKKNLISLLTRWQWVLLILAAPFLLFPSPRNCPVMLVIPLLWIAAGLVARQPLPKTPLSLSLLLLFIMVLVSEFATFDMASSLPKISGMVLGSGLFFSLIYSTRSEKGIQVGLGVFLAVGLGITSLGLLGTRWFNKITFLQPVVDRLPDAVRGLPGAESGFQPNEVAGALLWVFPLVLSLVGLIFVQKKWPERLHRSRRTAGLGLLITLIFMGGVFILTQSRTAFIALLVTFLCVPGVLLVHKRRWIYLVGIATLVIGFAIASWQLGWMQNLYTSTSSNSDPIGSLDTLNGRVEIWSRAIEGIRDFPVTGMGMNIFRCAINQLYPLFSLSSALDIGHAHNEFLNAALDLGIPGMVAFFSIYLVSFWMLVQIWRRNQYLFIGEQTHIQRSLFDSPASIQALVIGLSGSLLAHALFGMADAVALGAKPGILFWMLLGLITGLYQEQSSRQPY